ITLPELDDDASKTLEVDDLFLNKDLYESAPPSEQIYPKLPSIKPPNSAPLLTDTGNDVVSLEEFLSEKDAPSEQQLQNPPKSPFSDISGIKPLDSSSEPDLSDSGDSWYPDSEENSKKKKSSSTDSSDFCDYSKRKKYNKTQQIEAKPGCSKDSYEDLETESNQQQNTETSLFTVKMNRESVETNDQQSSSTASISNEKQLQRWKKSDPSKWKKNIAKINRHKCLPYHGKKGNIMQAKKPKHVNCIVKCRYQCMNHFSEDDRVKLCKDYWKIKVLTDASDRVARRVGVACRRLASRDSVAHKAVPWRDRCKMAVFSSHEDEILIELVSKNAPLFDTRLQAYKDNTVRDNIWEEIGKLMNKTSNDCKKRWKYIRDSYNRCKRKNKLPTGSSASLKTTKWMLYERLRFLEKIPTERTSVATVEAENTDDGESGEETSTTGISEQRRRSEEISGEERSNEEVKRAGISAAGTSGTKRNAERIGERSGETSNEEASGPEYELRSINNSLSLSSASYSPHSNESYSISNITHSSASNQSPYSPISSIASPPAQPTDLSIPLLNQKQFLLHQIVAKPIKTMKTGIPNEKHRSATYEYYFTKDDQQHRVCKDFFLKTLCMSNGPVNEAIKYKNEYAQDAKEFDKQRSMKDDTYLVVTADMQSTLHIPVSGVGILYYTRKLNVQNYTIHTAKPPNEAFCITWNEINGKRGSIEIASAMNWWIHQIPTMIRAQARIETNL
ncbi:hypothetical protein HW555_013628, partial [Spodoptera exigua]